MARVLIVGCGDLGSGLATDLVKAGHEIYAIRRSGHSFPQGVSGITGDIVTFEDSSLPEVDIIFLILTPNGRSQEAYKQSYYAAAERLVERYKCSQAKMFFVSSTSVYGQTDQVLIDESVNAEPATPTAKVLLETENLLRTQLPTTTIRFSGIYGEGRFRTIENVAKQVKWETNQWTNRIHRDDCVRVLALLANLHIEGQDLVETIIATDDAPVSQWELKLWIASNLGTDIAIEEMGLSAADFIPKSGKRLSNRLLKSLGFEFNYPSYVQGYEALIKSYKELNKVKK